MKNIKYKFYIYLCLSLFVLLSISGCSEDIDCSTLGDDYDMYGYDEKLKECVLVTSKKRDECGNGIAEKGETSCNCIEDVDIDLPIIEGGCSGNKGNYLEYFCNAETEVCDLEVTDKVKKNSKLLSLYEGTKFKVEATVNYYTPFMTDRHNVQVDFLLKDLMDTPTVKIKNLTIKKIYIVTQKKELLGDKSTSLKFKEKYDSFETIIPLDAFTFDTFDKEMKSVQLKLLINYIQETYRYDGEEYVLDKSQDTSVEVLDIFDTSLQLINPQNKAEDLEKTSSGWDI